MEHVSSVSQVCLRFDLLKSAVKASSDDPQLHGVEG